MQRRKIKYIALDLDGTLTTSDKKITDHTKEVIQEFIKKGGVVILSSGRPTYGVEGVADRLNLHQLGGIISAYNGGEITECRNGTVIFSEPLSNRVISELVRQAKDYGANLITYNNNRIVTENSSDRYCQIESNINKMEILQVCSLAEEVTYPVMKCIMTIEPPKMLALENRMRQQWGKALNIVHSQPFFLEITPSGIDKASSLAKILCFLGGSVEELAAFGDGMNDLSMLQYAGLGVAMSNAEPELKYAADMITLSNDEDGVALVVEDIIKNI